MGLDEDMIRSDLPVCNYPLIELINVVLYLNGSDFEVEECRMSNRPTPSEARRVVSDNNTSGIPAYRANGSARQPRHKQTPLIQGSIGFLTCTPELPPACTPEPELPPACTPEPELPPACIPEPELPPACTPESELPPACTPEPELPPACIPEPELPPACTPEP
ncbi:vegetative cell wall gp1-like isoform X4 [Labeo rohita]|uniref:Vegetative cell wall gp1-like isoform X4 n=1 Tax=Labeo rohita TaxID=84645 RepID=A0A498NMM9_LABRO|nr:vegetative cell wall gp1-like isoform X4 [Labeo rohita]